VNFWLPLQLTAQDKVFVHNDYRLHRPMPMNGRRQTQCAVDLSGEYVAGWLYWPALHAYIYSIKHRNSRDIIDWWLGGVMSHYVVLLIQAKCLTLNGSQHSLHYLVTIVNPSSAITFTVNVTVTWQCPLPAAGAVAMLHPACFSADGGHFEHMMWSGWSRLISRHKFVTVAGNWIKICNLV